MLTLFALFVDVTLLLPAKDGDGIAVGGTKPSPINQLSREGYWLPRFAMHCGKAYDGAVLHVQILC